MSKNIVCQWRAKCANQATTQYDYDEIHPGEHVAKRRVQTRTWLCDVHSAMTDGVLSLEPPDKIRDMRIKRTRKG